MTIALISDLHLDEQRPEITQLFYQFLQDATQTMDQLFILGDFFEAWIGDDDLSPFNLQIIKALHEATQKMPIYIMHGNRDFLLGKKFLEATGCQLLPDEYVTDIYGTPTLLMHGDTLCTLDYKYLAFRKKSRTWWYKKLVQLKSLNSRRKIVAKMRAISREHTRTTADYIMDVTQEEVARVMKKHNVQHIIHGHTHRQDVHQFEVNRQPVTRTVLGAWHDHGSVLICEKNGNQTFHKIG